MKTTLFFSFMASLMSWIPSQLGQHTVFMDPGPQQRHRLAVNVKGIEIQQERRVICQAEFYFTCNPMGIDNLPASNIGVSSNALLFHEKMADAKSAAIL